MNGVQIASFSSCKFEIIFENEFTNMEKISFLSFVAHLGSYIWESELATTVPDKNSHSLFPNNWGKTPLIKWRLYVSRSDLNRDLPISEKLRRIKLLDRKLSFSSIESKILINIMWLTSLRFCIKCSLEKFDECCKRELVHIINLD